MTNPSIGHAAPLSHTVKSPGQLSGIGLHSGASVTVELQPAREGGIRFVRSDLPASPVVPAALSCIRQTTHATVLGQDEATVSTTEHLLAALFAFGIHHCRIVLYGPELPILDGSALGWCRLLEQCESISTGHALPAYRLRRPVWYQEGDASLLGLPADSLRVSVAVDYGRSYAGPQLADYAIDRHRFTEQIAPARTFTLQEWVEPLRAQGLIRGGSTENAVVLEAEGPSSPWRFENELARHKLLDVVGDLSLLCPGAGFVGHLVAIRAGHGIHRGWMEKVIRENCLEMFAD